jgi:hypothetical protein
MNGLVLKEGAAVSSIVGKLAWVVAYGRGIEVEVLIILLVGLKECRVLIAVSY